MLMQLLVRMLKWRGSTHVSMRVLMGMHKRVGSSCVGASEHVHAQGAVRGGVHAGKG